jgi:hypothetical protein
MRPRSRDDPRSVMFTVILQAHLYGSPSHTTRDVIGADTCADAEARALAAWCAADPVFTYSPLLTVQHVQVDQQSETSEVLRTLHRIEADVAELKTQLTARQ